MKKLSKLLSILLLSITLISILVQSSDARRGCCSHHGGVCGCSCCDGKPLSNKCAPYYPECNGSSSYSSNESSYSSVSKPIKSYDCLTMLVTGSSAWLLEKPSLKNKKVLKTLSKNTKIVKTGELQNEFLQVVVANSKVRGWVHKSVCGCQ